MQRIGFLITLSVAMLFVESSCQTKSDSDAQDYALPHGKDLPDTVLTDVDRQKMSSAKGKTVERWAFSDLEALTKRTNDSVYIVNFWATWCKPCVAEMPDFERLQDAYEGEKVKLIFVSLDNPKELETRVLPFIRENQIRAKVVVLDETELSQTEWITKVDGDWSGDIPATLILQNSSKTRFFYPQSFTYNELVAIVQPLLVF